MTGPAGSAPGVAALRTAVAGQVSKNSRAVTALCGVIADGSRLAAIAACRAELEFRAPVRYVLTSAAEAALTAPGEEPAGPGRR